MNKIDWEEILPHTKSEAVSSTDLAFMLNMTNRQVRQTIQAARDDGVPICSDTTSNGYWYADCMEDIDKTIRQLHDRIVSMQRTMSALEKAKEAYAI